MSGGWGNIHLSSAWSSNYHTKICQECYDISMFKSFVSEYGFKIYVFLVYY